MSRGERARREQAQYELIRPCVLFHELAAERAKDTLLTFLLDVLPLL